MIEHNKISEAKMDKQEIEWFEEKNSGGVDSFSGWLRVRADGLKRLINSARCDKFSPAETDYLKESLKTIISEINSMILRIERYEKARDRQTDRHLGLRK